MFSGGNFSFYLSRNSLPSIAATVAGERKHSWCLLSCKPHNLRSHRRILDFTCIGSHHLSKRYSKYFRLTTPCIQQNAPRRATVFIFGVCVWTNKRTTSTNGVNHVVLLHKWPCDIIAFTSDIVISWKQTLRTDSTWWRRRQLYNGGYVSDD